VSAKGKAAPVPCVTVGWQGLSQPALAAGELFILELSRGPQGLRVAAIDGSAQKGTVKQYSDVPLPPDALDRLSESIAALAHGGGTAAYVEGLAVKGGELFTLAVPAAVRERLQETKLSQVRLQLDDALTHVPWELMHDGAQALGLKFGIGRLVAAKSTSAVNAAEKPVNEGVAVVVANPSGDLPRAAEEGRLVARLLENVFPGKVELKEGPLTTLEFLALLPRARLLHFAGHVKKENEARPGGFVLSDGVVTPEAMAPMLSQGVPALVFANACHASTGSKWSAAGNLAQGLLLAGVRHVLAPLYGVPDADALSFALRFYEALLAAHPYGEAARRAREALAESASSPLSWSGYVLYGDPRGALPAQTRPAVHDSGPTRSPRLVTGSNPAVRPVAAPLKVKWPAVAAVGLVVVGGGAFLALRGGDTKPVVETPKVAETPKPVAAPSRREGSIRLSVLAFKSSAKNEKLDFMNEGISESMVSGLAAEGFTLVERTQLELDLNELQFSQSEFVDPQTRAALGKVKGAEVVVIGAWQSSGEKLRLTARFVDVETGEILSTALVDGTAEDAFGAQDKLTAAVSEKLPALQKRLRK
jgi:TolB-like protein